jgi:hypothetical protein
VTIKLPLVALVGCIFIAGFASLCAANSGPFSVLDDDGLQATNQKDVAAVGFQRDCILSSYFLDLAAEKDFYKMEMPMASLPEPMLMVLRELLEIRFAASINKTDRAEPENVMLGHVKVLITLTDAYVYVTALDKHHYFAWHRKGSSGEINQIPLRMILH